MSTYQELKGHRDLKVYQLAYKLAMEIFEVSKKFPVSKFVIFANNMAISRR
jgi:hypothetical protein